MATKKVRVQVEKQPGEKNFSCFMVDDMPGFGLSGYGRTAKEAISDLKESYKEIKELLVKNGKEVPELDFEFYFDIGSYFDYYSFLNVSEVAKVANLNASMVRRYATGKSKPKQTTIDTIQSALRKISLDMQAAILC